uniref:Secreted protein n=1 Tax=Cacopsylla melanoneura TaxID=428564 RepID=A0A8D8X2P0_9HEMI
MTKWLLLLSVACMALVIVSARPSSEDKVAASPQSGTPNEVENRRVARKLAISPPAPVKEADDEQSRLGRQVSDATVAQVAAAASPIDAPAVPSGPAAAQPASDTQASPASPDEDEDDDDEDDDDDDEDDDDIGLLGD